MISTTTVPFARHRSRYHLGHYKGKLGLGSKLRSMSSRFQKSGMTREVMHSIETES